MTAHRRCVVAILLVFTLGASSAAAQKDPVDDFVVARISAAKVPGASLAVVKDGKVIKARGYGVADVETKTPATAETVYKIGSISKQFIAAAIVLLQQDGRLGFDDPAGRFLDGAPSSWSRITIRHLLTHTAGLVRESPAFNPSKVQPDESVLRAAYRLPLRFQPGQKWEYSNLGYFALAEIIRTVTGGPWPDYLRTRIFAPVGMAATAPTNTPPEGAAMAVGYTGNDNQRKADDWAALRPSGALVSTVLDLAKWDAATGNDRVLMRASRDLMATPVALETGATAPYGFGLHVDEANGRRRIWHGGGLPGFISHFLRFPDAGLTIILLANGDDVDLPSIANGVANLYLDKATGADAGLQALDASETRSAVKAVADVFAREYFDIPLSISIPEELRRRAASGRYTGFTAETLARRLTTDFFELTKDRHIAVALARRGGGSAGSAPERRDVPTSAGFRRTEIIAGNIGVLDMAFFMRPVEHRDALAAAMRTLQPADALILDMRENGGGSPGTVALLISYLLDVPSQPLFEIVGRDGSRQMYRTEASLLPARNAARPVFVLTSRRSFSGGEGLAFLLQDLNRATVIGEVTAGAANPGRPYPAGELFDITVPNGQLLTATSKRNWEGRGVNPDILVPAADAFRVAYLRAIDDLLAAATTADRREELTKIRMRLVAEKANRHRPYNAAGGPS